MMDFDPHGNDDIYAGFRAKARTHIVQHNEESLIRNQGVAFISGDSFKAGASLLEENPDNFDMVHQQIISQVDIGARITTGMIFRSSEQEVRDMRDNPAYAVPHTGVSLDGGVCVIKQLPESLAHKNELMGKMAGLEKNQMGAVSGSSEIYRQGVALHEAEHCIDASGILLVREARADKVTLEDMEANGRFQEAQVWRDTRAISGGDHATGPILDGRIDVEDGEMATRAAESFKEHVNGAVIQKLGITRETLLVQREEELASFDKEALDQKTNDFKHKLDTIGKDNIDLLPDEEKELLKDEYQNIRKEASNLNSIERDILVLEGSDDDVVTDTIKQESKNILLNNPNQYISALDEVLEDGSFAKKPDDFTGSDKEWGMVNIYAGDYAQAYRRQVIDPKPTAMKIETTAEQLPAHTPPIDHNQVAINYLNRIQDGETMSFEGKENLIHSLENMSSEDIDSIKEIYGEEIEPYLEEVKTREIENSVEYTTVTNAMEGDINGEIGPDQQKEIANVINNPNTDPSIITSLETRFGDELSEYKEPSQLQSDQTSYETSAPAQNINFGIA